MSDRGTATSRPGPPPTLDLAGPRDSCGADCPRFVEKWEGWWDETFDRHAPAMLAVTGQETYLQLIGAKSRNMLRKAVRHGYRFEEFNRNDHVGAIYAINRSKPVRSGGPMRQAYLERPALIAHEPRLCGCHAIVSVGMFSDSTLVAYAHLAGVNQLVVVNTILGHADHLPNGVMNALICAIVDALHRGDHHARYLNYTTMTGPDGLTRFKKSVGFAELDIDRART